MTPATAMMREVSTKKGSIKWYSIGRGYGFIASDDGDDVFLHHTSIVYAF